MNITINANTHQLITGAKVIGNQSNTAIRVQKDTGAEPTVKDMQLLASKSFMYMTDGEDIRVYNPTNVTVNLVVTT